MGESWRRKWWASWKKETVFWYTVWHVKLLPRPQQGDRVLFLIDFFVYLFLCFLMFVSLSARLRENGWTNLHEIFRQGVGWSRDNLIKFRVNSGKWVGRLKVNLLSLDVAIWFDSCLLAVLCCHLATENVMKLPFLAFCYIATWVRGLLCFAPQLVLYLIFLSQLFAVMWGVLLSVV